MATENKEKEQEESQNGIWKKLLFLAVGLGIRYAVNNFTEKIRERREEKEKEKNAVSV